jgi:hypothetical protein
MSIAIHFFRRPDMTNDVALYLPPPPPSIPPWLQGLAAASPALSPITTAVVAALAEQRDEAIQSFSEDVIRVIGEYGKRIDSLDRDVHNKIDRGHFWGDEFFRVFRSAIENQISSADTAKRKYLIDFVFRYALEKRPDITLERVFWRHVSALTGTHMVILDELYARQSTLNATDLLVLRTSSDRPELLSLKELCDRVSSDDILLRCLVSDLRRDGLIERIAGPINQADSSDRLLLEPPGHSLMRFICGDWQGTVGGTETA